MIKTIPISDIKTAYYNPRVNLTDGDADYKKIKDSIETFGYVEPIVWNERTGVLVGGHQRLQVLKDAGYKEVEVSVVNLSEADERQLNLALNKIKGQWDYQKLEDLLRSFEFYDINVTGFSADEVAILLEDGEDYEFEEFIWEEDTEDYGKSYLLQLKFTSIDKAKEWAEERGYKDQVKKGTKTTVIRVE